MFNSFGSRLDSLALTTDGYRKTFVDRWVHGVKIPAVLPAFPIQIFCLRDQSSVVHSSAIGPMQACRV